MPESLIVNSYSAMAEAEPDLSTFENKSGLAEDMKFLASMPELCDVTFLVGDTREPVCAVKAVLAARSRVFHKMLYQAPSPQRKKEPAPRENKLRLFLKRSSEPLLNLQNASQQATLELTNKPVYLVVTYKLTNTNAEKFRQMVAAKNHNPQHEVGGLILKSLERQHYVSLYQNMSALSGQDRRMRVDVSLNETCRLVTGSMNVTYTVPTQAGRHMNLAPRVSKAKI
ncbi:BTB/POZ domain [Popillia japonica]|uniref:BTB/POZ domain n=1 Tax=Popillia japonica TaxID=7064 RepID=A0AAW1I917_POPJA